MATRMIVTSQPDVLCEVCGRRLLRGERPERFLADGQPRTVCELCAPRALHEGWLREGERDSLTAPPARARRARGLLERLRGPREADDDAESSASPVGPNASATPSPSPWRDA